MTSALVPAAAAAPATLATRGDLVEAWLGGKTEATRRAYRADLEAFARHLGLGSGGEAATLLVASAPGDANAAALAWRNAMLEAGLAPATINRRLAALRSVVKLARVLGRITWTLEVPAVKARAYRDTRGPGRAGVKAMLAAVEGDDEKARRDRLVLRLLWDLGLRRAELVGIDLADLDLEAPAVTLRHAKGRREAVRLTLPAETVEAIRVYLERRGEEPGPLVRSLDPAGKGSGRLSASGVYGLVRGLAERAGVSRRVSPHRVRHAAITARLDATSGDVRACARFSRHAKVETLMVYDDSRRDVAGDVAALGATLL